MMIRIATLAATFLFAATLTTAAPVPKGKTFAEKLVGRWEMKTSRGKAPSQPVHLVMTKDLKLTLEYGTGDDADKHEGSYKIDGEAFHYEVTAGDAKRGEKLDVTKLTDDEMTVTDPDGIVEEFKRVKDEKKEDKKDEKKGDEKKKNEK